VPCGEVDGDAIDREPFARAAALPAFAARSASENAPIARPVALARSQHPELGMSEPRELRCYEYVTVPYERVRDALRRDASGIFQRATASAATRAHELVATLRVGVGALEIGTDVKIQVRAVNEQKSALGDRSTEVALAWTAASAASLFPSMEATLSVYALSASETQIDLHGRYRPPLGALGNALDALAGHRVAEASVLRFVQDVAARLEAELSERVTS
jgi:hypothetical protein